MPAQTQKSFSCFLSFRKNVFWSSSCHAYDKILYLSLRLGTSLATPIYQASIDTLRHSITSRIIFYTTFWFLSIPFGKIIGNFKKFSDAFLMQKRELFFIGKVFILSHLFLFMFCAPNGRRKCDGKLRVFSLKKTLTLILAYVIIFVIYF